MPESKYRIKCPYTMVPEFVVVHNTANDASAMAEISYMIGNNNTVSFQYAVDDYRAVQGIEENRNGWHAGDGSNGKGNRKGIAIEICYSKSGGERFNKAEDNAVELIVDILKRYGWGIDRVKKHQDFMKKYCPHRTLDLGWQRFLDKISAKLEKKPAPQSVNNSTKKDEFLHSRGYFRYGDDGAEIHKICEFFAKNYWGYFGNTKKTAHDKLLGKNGKGDYFGPNLKAWVIDFQRRLGLKQDGFIGPITLGEMRRLGFKY